MIKSYDRSGWFGASDARHICGKWDTASFASWWLVKLGWISKNFTTKEMLTGTHYEHRIALKISEIVQERLTLDRQIKIHKYRLRINYDADTCSANHEIKTYNLEKGFEKVPHHYWQQCQVQMFGNGKEQLLWAYGLVEADYVNYFNDIDTSRLKNFLIERDDDFINNTLIPRLKVLARCLKKGIFPKIEMIKEKAA